MTHNPNWNKYPVGGRPWTAEEDRIAAEMRAAGLTMTAIGERLDRTENAVDGRFQYLRITPEEKQRRQRIRRDRARASLSGDNCWKVREGIPAHVIEDRDRRLSAPRSLTAIICGDPIR